MIEPLIMYVAECDNCKELCELSSGYVAMADKTLVLENVKEADEWAYLTNGKIYCPNCHTVERGDGNEDVLLAFSKDTQNSGAILLGEID